MITLEMIRTLYINRSLTEPEQVIYSLAGHAVMLPWTKTVFCDPAPTIPVGIWATQYQVTDTDTGKTKDMTALACAMDCGDSVIATFQYHNGKPAPIPALAEFREGEHRLIKLPSPAEALPLFQIAKHIDTASIALHQATRATIFDSPDTLQ